MFEWKGFYPFKFVDDWPRQLNLKTTYDLFNGGTSSLLLVWKRVSLFSHALLFLYLLVFRVLILKRYFGLEISRGGVEYQDCTVFLHYM